MTDTYLASIDDFEFDCETIDDRIRKSIAYYRYPYRNGAETEDMGEDERVIRIRAYWLEDSYSDHFAFLEHLKSSELFELSHPKYGLMQGRVEDVSVRHDDRQQTAEVDITFVQDIISQEQTVKYGDIQNDMEESFTEGQTELSESFKESAKEVLGGEAADILETELDPELGIVEQLTGYSTAARNWLKNVETYVTTLQATANSVANPANSLISMINYGTQLPGRVIGAVANTLERYAVAAQTLRDAPGRFIQNLQNSMADLLSQAEALDESTGGTVFYDLTQVAGAQRISVEIATIYKEDESARSGQRQREENADAAFDVEGNYIQPETVGPVMTVRELEQTLADVRSELQTALDADRNVYSLKTMARQLLDHVATVKLERDRIERIELPNPMPLHLVCLMRGLPYTWAERIMAINDISHPNFIDGEIDVYVR